MSDEKPLSKEISGSEYLRASFHPSDRLAVLVRNRKRGQTIQRITTAARIAEPAFQDWLHYKNDQDSCDIYVGMNALKPGASTRTKDDIQTIRHLYLDLDCDGPASLAAIQQSTLLAPANYVLHTSPDKFQVVWKVEEVTREQAESLLRAMARKYHADPAATDSTRVMRLPGFVNKKYDVDFIVRAERQSDRTHHFLDFKLRLDPADSDPRPIRTHAARTDSRDSRPLSQSEHDWAYAKRALARGDDPEKVIQRIADFRRQDKSDPVYYARHTVMKAQAASSQRGEDGNDSTTDGTFLQEISGCQNAHDPAARFKPFCCLHQRFPRGVMLPAITKNYLLSSHQPFRTINKWPTNYRTKAWLVLNVHGLAVIHL